MDRFAHMSMFAYMQIFAHVCKFVHVKAALHPIRVRRKYPERMNIVSGMQEMGNVECVEYSKYTSPTCPNRPPLLSVHMSCTCISICQILFEPEHEKTYKITCACSKDSDQPAYARSLISLRCPHEEALSSWLLVEFSVNTLTRFTSPHVIL